MVVAVLTIVKMARGGWLREVVDDDGRSISVASSEYDEIVDVGYVFHPCFAPFSLSSRTPVHPSEVLVKISGKKVFGNGNQNGMENVTNNPFSTVNSAKPLCRNLISSSIS